MRIAIPRPVVYFTLSAIGLVFTVYSIAIKNYGLLIISILFAGVSAYNIFCGMKAKTGGN